MIFDDLSRSFLIVYRMHRDRARHASLDVGQPEVPHKVGRAHHAVHAPFGGAARASDRCRRVRMTVSVESITSALEFMGSGEWE